MRRLQSGETYQLDLTGDQKVTEIPVVITCSVDGAEVFVDSNKVGITSNKMLTTNISTGEHIIRVDTNGFKPKEITETISTSNNSFNFDLKVLEPVMLTIKSNPKEADIYINNIKEGSTNKQLFKYPDNYQLRIVKDKFDSVEETITVTSSGSNEFSYTLLKSTAVLTVNTTPSGCEISVNRSMISGNSKEVSAGTYLIEVSKDGWYTQTRTVQVEKGRDIIESFILKQKTGKLQFVVEPMEAKTTMKYIGSTYKSWSGSKHLSKIPVGSYELAVDLNGYKKQTRTISIKENETTQTNVTLEKGVSKPAYTTSGSIEMVFVEGGTFQMGSNDGSSDEKPVHSVTVNDFYIGKYEVTQKQWKEVMGNNPSRFRGEDNPVEKVSWYDTVEFCNKLSEREGLSNCYSGSGKGITLNINANGYRMPTEAEWGFAAIGGNKSKGYKYSGSNSIGDVAWYDSNSRKKTHLGGTKQANELGIYDMSGNVWEWCWDWYGSYNRGSQLNPTGVTYGSYRVYMGGSWYFNASDCRIANRCYNFPDGSSDDIGFRLVRSFN